MIPSKKLPLLPGLLLLLVNINALAQNAADRALIKEKTNTEALTKIIEARNQNYQSDLALASQKGIPLVIFNQSGEKGYFCALLKNGPSYYFDDASTRSKSNDLKKKDPNQLNKKQIKKAKLPKKVTAADGTIGRLRAISGDGNPIYYFKKAS